jgi:hypothetical protein
MKCTKDVMIYLQFLFWHSLEETKGVGNSHIQLQYMVIYLRSEPGTSKTQI